MIFKKRVDGILMERETDERDANDFKKGAVGFLMGKNKIF